jgi:hypothetical protein
LLPKDVRYAIQLLIINEAAMNEFFNVRHFNDTKLLLERRGKSAGVNFTNSFKLYEGASIIMNMSRLPFDTRDCFEYEVLKTRTIICRMDNHTHKITEDFPFNTRQLAIYLLQRYKIEFPEEHWIDEELDH